MLKGLAGLEGLIFIQQLYYRQKIQIVNSEWRIYIERGWQSSDISCSVLPHLYWATQNSLYLWVPNHHWYVCEIPQHQEAQKKSTHRQNLLEWAIWPHLTIEMPLTQIINPIISTKQCWQAGKPFSWIHDHRTSYNFN